MDLISLINTVVIESKKLYLASFRILTFALPQPMEMSTDKATKWHCGNKFVNV